MIFPYLKILKRRNFFLLWFGQVISQFGDRLTQMALIGLVYKLQPNSPVGLAKIFSLAIIPVFLLSPVAGVYIDRWNKKKTMYISDFLRGVFIFLIPIFLFKFQIRSIVYILIFLSFCAGRFFIPAKMSIIPHLVNKEEFFLANSLVSLTAMIAAVLGFGLGGVIVERLGLASAFFIDASTFIISAIFIFFMRTQEETNFKARDFLDLGKDAFIKVKNSFLFEIKDGLKYILRSKETLYAAKVLFFLFASLGSLYTLFIVFIQNTLSTVTIDLGKLAVGAGLGLFLGSLFYGRFAHHFPLKKTIIFSYIFGNFYLLFFVIFLKFHPSKTFAFFSCLLLGIIISPIVIAINTLIHRESKDDFWGRIFSSFEFIIHLAFVIFMFLSSYLAEKFSPFTIIISVCIISVSLALFSLKERKVCLR
jgi:MFS family permease